MSIPLVLSPSEEVALFLINYQALRNFSHLEWLLISLNLTCIVLFKKVAGCCVSSFFIMPIGMTPLWMVSSVLPFSDLAIVL